MWLPNAPARRMRSIRSSPVSLQQKHAARMERSLRQLDLADVVLRDRELRLAVVQDVRERASVRHDARRARGERAVDRSVGRENPRQVELGHGLDDPRPADAGHVCLLEPRLVRPRVAADHPIARLEGVEVDAHPLDRAGSGPLAARDLGPFERWPRGARRGEKALSVADHDLRIGAHVDEEVTSSPRCGPSDRITPAVSAPT